MQSPASVPIFTLLLRDYVYYSPEPTARGVGDRVAVYYTAVAKR